MATYFQNSNSIVSRWIIALSMTYLLKSVFTSFSLNYSRNMQWWIDWVLISDLKVYKMSETHSSQRSSTFFFNILYAYKIKFINTICTVLLSTSYHFPNVLSYFHPWLFLLFGLVWHGLIGLLIIWYHRHINNPGGLEYILVRLWSDWINGQEDTEVSSACGCHISHFLLLTVFTEQVFL